MADLLPPLKPISIKERLSILFIEKGQRVKVSVFFRGREITHPDLGRQMLRSVVDQIQDVAKVDIEPRLEGRNMAMLLTPKG